MTKPAQQTARRLNRAYRWGVTHALDKIFEDGKAYLGQDAETLEIWSELVEKTRLELIGPNPKHAKQAGETTSKEAP